MPVVVFCLQTSHSGSHPHHVYLSKYELWTIFHLILLSFLFHFLLYSSLSSCFNVYFYTFFTLLEMLQPYQLVLDKLMLSVLWLLTHTLTYTHTQTPYTCIDTQKHTPYTYIHAHIQMNIHTQLNVCQSPTAYPIGLMSTSLIHFSYIQEDLDFYHHIPVVTKATLLG